MNVHPEQNNHSVNGEDSGTCPAFHAAIELIGRRWNGVILQQLMGGPLRFFELRDRIPGVTEAMLSQRLKDLEAAEVVTRIVGTGRPLQVHYELTGIGHQLAPILEAVASWGTDWAATAPSHVSDQDPDDADLIRVLR